MDRVPTAQNPRIANSIGPKKLPYLPTLPYIIWSIQPLLFSSSMHCSHIFPLIVMPILPHKSTLSFHFLLLKKPAFCGNHSPQRPVLTSSPLPCLLGHSQPFHNALLSGCIINGIGNEGSQNKKQGQNNQQGPKYETIA